MASSCLPRGCVLGPTSSWRRAVNLAHHQALTTAALRTNMKKCPRATLTGNAGRVQRTRPSTAMEARRPQEAKVEARRQRVSKQDAARAARVGRRTNRTIAVRTSWVRDAKGHHPAARTLRARVVRPLPPRATCARDLPSSEGGQGRGKGRNRGTRRAACANRGAGARTGA